MKRISEHKLRVFLIVFILLFLFYEFFFPVIGFFDGLFSYKEEYVRPEFNESLVESLKEVAFNFSVVDFDVFEFNDRSFVRGNFSFICSSDVLYCPFLIRSLDINGEDVFVLNGGEPSLMVDKDMFVEFFGEVDKADNYNFNAVINFRSENMSFSENMNIPVSFSVNFSDVSPGDVFVENAESLDVDGFGVSELRSGWGLSYSGVISDYFDLVLFKKVGEIFFVTDVSRVFFESGFFREFKVSSLESFGLAVFDNSFSDELFRFVD